VRRKPWRGVAATLAVIAATALLPAGSPASATSDAGVLLSEDGVHWSGRLASNVFTSGKPLVPGDELAGSFYVKNGSERAAYLRIGLSSLAVTDWTLAQAITMTTTGTSSSDASGTAASFGGPGVVCSDLLRRESPLAPGEIVLVSTALRFRSTVSGTEAQGEIAQIGFIVELSDIDLDATSTPLCTGSIQVGPVDVTGGGGTGDDGSGSSDGSSDGTGAGGQGTAGTDDGAASGSGGEVRTGAGSGAGDGSSTPAVGTASGTISFGLGGDVRLAAPANTMRLYEEYAILVLLGAALAGMLLRLGAQRRWERQMRENEE